MSKNMKQLTFMVLFLSAILSGCQEKENPLEDFDQLVERDAAQLKVQEPSLNL